jgi:hypothetical protein
VRPVLAGVLLLLASVVEATPRVYLIPTTGTGGVVNSAPDPVRPKYVREAGLSYLQVTYGRQPVALVFTDVTAGQHTALAANGDVVAIPANIDTTVGANLATVQNALEALNIPADGCRAARRTGKCSASSPRFSISRSGSTGSTGWPCSPAA